MDTIPQEQLTKVCDYWHDKVVARDRRDAYEKVLEHMGNEGASIYSDDFWARVGINAERFLIEREKFAALKKED